MVFNLGIYCICGLDVFMNNFRQVYESFVNFFRGIYSQTYRGYLNGQCLGP